MSAGVAGTLLFVIIMSAALVGVWIATRPQPEEPPGVDIIHESWFGWSYYLEEHGVFSTGYLTRTRAIREAQQELQDLEHTQEAT